MKPMWFGGPTTTHWRTFGPLYVVLTDDGTGPFGQPIDQEQLQSGAWLTVPTPPERMEPHLGFRVVTEPWDTWAFEDMRVYEVAIQGHAIWYEADQCYYVQSLRLVRAVGNPPWFEGAREFVAMDLTTITFFQPEPLANTRSTRFEAGTWAAAIQRAVNAAGPRKEPVLSCAYLARCSYNVRAAFPARTHYAAHTLFNYQAQTTIERRLARVDLPLGADRDWLIDNIKVASSAMATLLVYERLCPSQLDMELHTIRAAWSCVLNGWALVGVTKDGVPLVAAGPRRGDQA